jgi:hypothetical protein
MRRVLGRGQPPRAAALRRRAPRSLREACPGTRPARHRRPQQRCPPRRIAQVDVPYLWAGLLVNGNQAVVAGSSLSAGRGRPEPESRWSGQRVAGTTTLTRHGMPRDEVAKRQLGLLLGITSSAWPGMERGARASSLISVLGPVSGDVMGDRVPAHGGCGRSFYGGRPRPAWRQEHRGASRTTSADPGARAHDGCHGQAAVGSSAGTSAWSPSWRRVW